MSTLYIDRKNVELRVDGGALLFYEGNERQGTVPLQPLSRVFMRGDVQLSASVLGKLGEHGVGVVVLSGRKASPSLLLGCPHNDAARRVAQYRMLQNPAHCLGFSKAIVTAKLEGQRQLLEAFKENLPMQRYVLHTCARRVANCLAQVDTQTCIASLRGIEGAGAAAYFEGLAEIFPASLKFSGRNRRPPRDPVNAVLSLTYTLLQAEATLALYGSGLDPFIGFYHSLDFGRESLACDLMEALRPQADRFVIALFRKEILLPAHFSTTSSGCLLGKAGRAHFYTAYETEAEGFRRELNQATQDIVHCLKNLPEEAA